MKSRLSIDMLISAAHRIRSLSRRLFVGWESLVIAVCFLAAVCSFFIFDVDPKVIFSFLVVPLVLGSVLVSKMMKMREKELLISDTFSQSSGFLIIFKATEQKPITVAGNTRRFFGFEDFKSSQQLLNLEELIDPQMQSHYREHFEKICSGKMQETSLTLGLKNKKGTSFWLQVELQQFRLKANGKVDEVLLSATDVTEIIIKNDELAKSEERFRLATEGVDAGLWDWDMIQDRMYFSPRWKTMLGYQDNEIEDRFLSWMNLVHPDDYQKAEKILNDYLNGRRRDFHIEYRLRTRGGEFRWILTQGAVHRNSQGKPVRFTGWNFDIHEQKITEEEIQKLSHAREEILSSIKDGFLSIRRDFLVLYANQPAAQIFETSAEQLVGQKLNTVLFNASASVFIKNFERAIRAQIKVEFEAHYGVNDYHVIAYPSAEGLSILYRDVTEQIALRRDVEDQKVALVSASKLATLGEMAGGIAHEINNPLAVIVGKAQILRTLLSRNPIDSEKVNKAVSSIEETGNRIAKIIRGLRSFARDEEHDPFVDTAVSSIIEDTLAFCQTRFQIHGIELKVIGMPNVETKIECRAAQIGQVLINLLNNAFDAVGEYEAKWVELAVSESENQFQITVTDSGNGIPSIIREKMMNPFFTTKDVGKGTGLGLSISKGLIEGHGGRFYYDENCKNTRFVIDLPKRPAEVLKKNVA